LPKAPRRGLYGEADRDVELPKTPVMWLVHTGVEVDKKSPSTPVWTKLYTGLHLRRSSPCHNFINWGGGRWVQATSLLPSILFSSLPLVYSPLPSSSAAKHFDAIFIQSNRLIKSTLMLMLYTTKKQRSCRVQQLTAELMDYKSHRPIAARQ